MTVLPPFSMCLTLPGRCVGHQRFTVFHQYADRHEPKLPVFPARGIVRYCPDSFRSPHRHCYAVFGAPYTSPALRDVSYNLQSGGPVEHPRVLRDITSADSLYMVHSGRLRLINLACGFPQTFPPCQYSTGGGKVQCGVPGKIRALPQRVRRAAKGELPYRIRHRGPGPALRRKSRTLSRYRNCGLAGCLCTSRKCFQSSTGFSGGQVL